MQDKIISGDSHFNEPYDFYLKRVSSKYKDQAPRIVNISNKSFWKFQNKLRPIGLDNQAGIKNKNLKKIDNYKNFKHFDLNSRKKITIKDGVSHEVMLPSGGLLYTCNEDDLIIELFSIYNGFCLNESNDYYTFVPMLPSKPDLAIKILKNIIPNNKSKAVLIPIYPGEGFYSNNKWKKLFKILNNEKYTVVMHAGGVRCLPREKLNYKNIGFKNSISIYQGMETISDLFFSGMLSKYNKINFYFSEIGTSWLPGFFERINFCYEKYKFIDKYNFKNINNYLKNIYFSFQQDFPKISKENKNFSNYLFGSDFPHAESTYPNSLKKYNDAKKKYGKKITSNLFCNNAKKLFNIK